MEGYNTPFIIERAQFYTAGNLQSSMKTEQPL